MNQQDVLVGGQQLQLPPGVKVPLPDIFNGGIEEDPRTFLFQFVEFFELFNITNERVRIVLAVNRLGKVAAAWWRSYLTAHPDPATRHTTFVGWGNLLAANFMPVNASQAARDKLRNYSMGNRTLREYLYGFRKLVNDVQPPMADEEKLDKFLGGLPLWMRREIDKSYPAITLFERAAEMAERLEATNRRLNAAYSSNSSNRRSYRDAVVYGSDQASNRNRSANQASHSRNGPAPMEVDAIGAGSGNGNGQRRNGGGDRRGGGRNDKRMPPRLDPQERERCRREGLCFRCRRGGHIGRDCPNNRRN